MKINSRMFNFFLKIILPTLLAVLFFILTLFYTVIPLFEKSIMDRKREMIQELTNSASSILDKYYNEQIEGKLSKEEAQKTAIARIQYLRYGEENKDYFWVTDTNAIMIMHPYIPELNGTDLSNYEDSHGKKIFIDFCNLVKEKEKGFEEYMWQWKDDSTHIVPKLSYVKGFKPWGWIIGTGIYIEDVKSEISLLTNKLLRISINIVAIIAIILSFVSIQSLKIERKKQSAESKLQESREKYRSLVEASTEGLIMISENSIIFANSIFLKMSGMKFSELENIKWQNIFCLPKKLSLNIENSVYDIESESFETEINLPGNRKTEVLINITPIIFYNRKAFIFSIKDISSDKLIKKELTGSRERYKKLMDILNVGIFRTTMDSRGKFIDANETAIKLLGFENENELKNKYIIDLFADTQDKKTFRKILLKEGFIKNKTIKLIQANGKQTLNKVSIALLTGEDGLTVYCEGVIEVISKNNTEEGSSNKLLNYNDLKNIFNIIEISKVKNPIFFINHNTKFESIIKKLFELKTNVVFVKDTENNILGFISYDEIINSIVYNNDFKNLQAYQLMNSPIAYLEEDKSLLSAKIFFSNNKHKFCIIKNEYGLINSYISANDICSFNESLLFELIEKISDCESIDSIKAIKLDFSMLVSTLIDNNLNTNIGLQLMSEFFDSVTKRLFELAIAEIGEAPAEFSFIVMGSEGRNEQTLKTDQDNAIIYEDPDEINEEKYKNYFLKLGEWICHSMNKVGYSYCEGNNMAMNPKWNQPISVWKNYFHKWINTAQPKDLLTINIFFDFRLSYGNIKFADELRDSISFDSQKNPAFIHHMAINAVQFKQNINDKANIKEPVSALVNFARVYALKNNLSEKNTLQRFFKLNRLGVINNTNIAEIEVIYDYLCSQRLKHQSKLILKNLEPDNYINFESMTDFEKASYKKAINTVLTILSKLNFDFRLSI